MIYETFYNTEEARKGEQFVNKASIYVFSIYIEHASSDRYKFLFLALNVQKLLCYNTDAINTLNVRQFRLYKTLNYYLTTIIDKNS